MPLAELIASLLPQQRRPLRDRLPVPRVDRVEDHTGPAYAHERELVRRQIEEDNAYWQWVERRKMIEGLARALSPGASIPEPPPE